MPPRKTPRTSKSNYPDSFRIKLGGTGVLYTTAEFRQMLHEAADQIEAAGITHVDPSYLYVKPRDEKGKAITRVRGQQLEDVTIPGPYRSAADEHGL
jgi:hypothetical protein